MITALLALCLVAQGGLPYTLPVSDEWCLPGLHWVGDDLELLPGWEWGPDDAPVKTNQETRPHP